MNSHERIKMILRGEQPDRIPYGEYAIDSDTVEKIVGHETYLRNKRATREALWDGRRDEVVQSYKEDMVTLYKKLDICDIVNLMSDSCGMVPPADYEPLKPEKIDDTTWKDINGCIYKYSETTRDIVMVEDPMLWEREYEPEDFDLEEELTPPDETCFEAIDYVISQFVGDRYLASCGGREAGFLLPGNMERGLTEYITNPEGMQAMIDYDTRWGNFEDQYFIRKGQDAVLWGQDFCYNKGPLMDPKYFYEMVLPSIKSRVANVHALGCDVLKHCCGNTLELMPLFLEAGYDAYQSLQKSAGVKVPALREKVGKKLALWGGVDVSVLLNGTREDVIRETRGAIAEAREGMMILGSSHSIATGCKYDNYMTMLDIINNEAYY